MGLLMLQSWRVGKSRLCDFDGITELPKLTEFFVGDFEEPFPNSVNSENSVIPLDFSGVGFADKRGRLSDARRLVFGHGFFAGQCRWTMRGVFWARSSEASREFCGNVFQTAEKLRGCNAMLASFRGVCLNSTRSPRGREVTFYFKSV
jgi:hypothetical protein